MSNHSRLRPSRLLAVLALLALVAGACGGGGDDSSSSSADGSSDDTVVVGQTELEADTAEPQYGGTLTYGIEADTSNRPDPALGVRPGRRDR